MFHGFYRIFQELNNNISVRFAQICAPWNSTSDTYFSFTLFRKENSAWGRIPPPFGLLAERLGGSCMRTPNLSIIELKLYLYFDLILMNAKAIFKFLNLANKIFMILNIDRGSLYFPKYVNSKLLA